MDRKCAYKLYPYLWLEMWVNVVGSCADKAYLLVEKVVSVSFSAACCIIIPLHCYKKRSRKQIDVSVQFRRCWCLLFDTNEQQHTLISCKSWRGKLEIWRPLAELARLGPTPVLVLLFLLFLRLCLRRSWSFFLCFLFVKKQTRLWIIPDHKWTTYLMGKFQMYPKGYIYPNFI